MAIKRRIAIKKLYFRSFIYEITDNLFYCLLNTEIQYIKLSVMRKRCFCFLFFLIVVVSPLLLQGQIWMQFPVEMRGHDLTEERVVQYSFPIFDDAVKANVELQNVKTAPLDAKELNMVLEDEYSADFKVNAIPLRSRDEALLSVGIVPFRKSGDGYEKLVSATLSVTLLPDMSSVKANPRYATQSAMASGNWYKIGLASTGIYKLTYSDLQDLGVNVASVDPRQIRIYHNGGGVLPEMNSVERHDDLVEVPIFVAGESDGTFDSNDYILFYGRGPVVWSYNDTTNVYEHIQNPYDDYAYAFVVTGKGQGKRIGEGVSVSASADETVLQFLDYQVHEDDKFNLNNTGRTYYGDKMEGNSTSDFNFSFPNAVTSRLCSIKTELAGRNYSPASFDVTVDGVKKATYSINSTSSSNNLVYGYCVGGRVWSYPTSGVVHVTLQHNATGNSTSDGYVDYIAVNAWRNLVFSGSQMSFRNPDASINNKVYEYRLSNASQQVQVWNVSDPVTPQRVKGQLQGSTYTYKTYGSPNNEFIAFNGSSYYTAKLIGKIANQNLHGLRDVDYLIVSYIGFKEAAERLQSLHSRIDPDLTSYVTTPELIYNEFSCGAKDITAIRDFCRMLYLDSNPGRRIKYLLLLGDCSFDYKNRSGVVDFVPAFESVASLLMEKTFVTDDYFGFMDANEGNIGASLADIGIGRFPVSTQEQANQMVDKIERYVEKDASTMGPWRNTVTFFTDDEGGFVTNAEEMAAMLKNVGGQHVVVDKIYLDAYPQVSSPGGEIAPEVNQAVNSRMEKGTLVLNYTGHGGEVQLAEERIMQRKDVDSWRNAPMYPLMITGTCEFSRYDDHDRTSLGEYAFLNPYGGMVAMFTTSRVTHGSDNLDFNKGVYNNLFRITGGELYHLGDVYRMAKTKGTRVEKRYVFFGDPALRLAYPKWTVETLSINGQAPECSLDSIQVNDSTWYTGLVYLDTISALQPVEIEGVVKDLSGNEASSFNGVVHVTVYDKETELSTMGTEADVENFRLRNSVIFNGKTDVKNGHFKISFIVPRDIAYRFGQGLISYYATDYEVDANGSCDSFIIGGFFEDAVEDMEAPEIQLFIDDTLFVSGGLTSENPTLLAFVEDESGINTTGAGIGHDIMATLSGPTKNSYCLNAYFVSEVDNPGKGVISFKMQDLEDGTYVLTLKVWDIYNNSSTAAIVFNVSHSDGMVIEHPGCVPNPVTDEAGIVFEHNQMGNNLQVDIYIYDIMGRLVTTLSEMVSGTSTRVSPIRWNGRSAHGAPLRNGVYIYRIVATNDKGETASAVSKLVLSK